MRVLVTDGRYKHALAAVRALGRENIEVVVGTQRKGICSYSKFCSSTHTYPSPSNEEVFISSILKCIKDENIDVLIPIGYETNRAISKNKAIFQGKVGLLLSDFEKMSLAGDKSRTAQLAREVGVPTPREYELGDPEITFPLVVKDRLGAGKVRYINTKEELEGINLNNVVVQEYVMGEGYGFFALMKGGVAKAIFMHKRLREYPITGGPSTMAESVYDPQLEKEGLKMLEALKWDGVAMVEFKKDARSGEFKLMEVNPKFWGSLDLAIASGVNFPSLMAKLTLGEDFPPIRDYLIGVKFRWVFPDDLMYHLAMPSKLGEFVTDFFDRGIRDNLDRDDIIPNIIQIVETVPKVYSLLRSKKLRYPQGRPMVRK